MIGVVADDTTGANDIGIMFRKNGYTVKILTFEEGLKPVKDSDVLIIDTDSRLDPFELSRYKVCKSTEILKEMDCDIYFNKTCSVFRGNIGTEFDAMMDALDEEFKLITLAFPKTGRTTINGIHKVNGLLLEDSNFANDPVHPMVTSNLVEILEKETDRKVCSIGIDIVRQGPKRLKEEVEKVKAEYNYCIVDSETQDDLKIVAEVAVDYRCLGGSSAIAEELPKFIAKEVKEVEEDKIDIKDENGVLIVSGSLTPQTKGQTAHLREIDVDTLIMDSRRIFSDSLYEVEKERMVTEGMTVLKDGRDLLIMADDRKEVVSETKQLGKEIGIDELKVSKKVSQLLSEVAEELVIKTDLKRLVVAGGDTSGTICRQLGIKGNYVVEEIETGLPSGLAIGKEMLIVLKSGSFGGYDFLEKSIKHLKELSN